MEGITISISKEALSDLIQGAVRSALTEFRKSVSQADEPKDDLLPAEARRNKQHNNHPGISRT